MNRSIQRVLISCGLQFVLKTANAPHVCHWTVSDNVSRMWFATSGALNRFDGYNLLCLCPLYLNKKHLTTFSPEEKDKLLFDWLTECILGRIPFFRCRHY